MPPSTVGMKLEYGSSETLPLRGFPKGRARIRQRPNNFVQVFIKTESGIRGFYAKRVEDHWEPGPEFGSNTTIQIQ